MNMKFIQFEPKTMTVYVTDAKRPRGANVPVSESDIEDNPYNSRIPFLSTIYNEVLYPAKEAEDKKAGRNLKYYLVPPDPWLIALGLVMWEGIVQGMAWGAVKTLINSALEKLRKEGVAPSSDKHRITRKESVELGFCWVEYCGEKKLREMFVGLRKHREKQTKPQVRKATAKKRK